MLDKLQVEQERGITIKSQTVRLEEEWHPRPWNLEETLTKNDLETFLEQTEHSEDFDELIDLLEEMEQKGETQLCLYLTPAVFWK